eukprot:gene7544-8381_t
MSDERENSDVEGKKSFDWTFVKGFAAGVVISHVNKNLILGVLVGTIAGFYVEQNIKNVPNIRAEAGRILTIAREALGKSKRDD